MGDQTVSEHSLVMVRKGKHGGVVGLFMASPIHRQEQHAVQSSKAWTWTYRIVQIQLSGHASGQSKDQWN